MKKNKGFTLIELLAVLLVLAIIALIAVPIITNLIKSSRINSSQNAVHGLFDAVDVYYGRKIILDNGVFNNNETLYIAFGSTFDENEEGLVNGDTNIEYNGTKITAGKISLDRNGKITIVKALEVNGYYCIMGANDKAQCTETKPEGY